MKKMRSGSTTLVCWQNSLPPPHRKTLRTPVIRVQHDVVCVCACVGSDNSEGHPVLHPPVLLPLVLLGLLQVWELVDFDLARQNLLHDRAGAGGGLAVT